MFFLNEHPSKIITEVFTKPRLAEISPQDIPSKKKRKNLLTSGKVSIFADS